MIGKACKLAAMALLAVFWMGTGHTQTVITERGLIVDSKTSKPVQGARVSVTGNLAAGDDITDDEGRFSLRLLKSVQAGQSLRIRVDHPDYEVRDTELAASAQTITTIKITRKGAARAAVPRIENVVFIDGDAGSKTIELWILNPTAQPLLLKKLQLKADFAVAMAGITGFISRVEYELHVKVTTHGEVKGKADQPGQSEPGYDVQGYFGSESNTRSKGEKNWVAQLGTELPLRIDPADELIVRINLAAPTLLKTNEENDGAMVAASIMGIKRDSLTITLYTEADTVLTWYGSARPILGWIESAKRIGS